jgi:hypothetical protein
VTLWTDLRLIIWVIFWFSTSALGVIIVVFCEYKIFRHLKAFGDATHDQTKRLHKEFHRALLAMVRTYAAIGRPKELFTKERTSLAMSDRLGFAVRQW